MTKSITTSGTIVHTDRNGVQYRICKIDYTERDDDTFEYVFTPDYDMISLLPRDEFQGIPGLDLDLHQDRYVRRDFDPVFITERTPGPNREDLTELLDSVGMDHLNRLEWSIRTKLRYNRDCLHVIRYEDVKGEVDLSTISTSSAGYCMDVLTAIGTGRTAVMNGSPVDGTVLITVCDVLRASLASERHERRRRGRKTAPTTDEQISEAAERLRKGEEAGAVAGDLGVSRATLYRRLKAVRGITGD